ncbi:DUF6053 domain-containing protein [Lysobacter yananisis]|uniref:DUF6053 domain-containing protein n=1 Tax=Lysobacter yananisis TaxID=1003114 RepID=UPI003CE4EDE9
MRRLRERCHGRAVVGGPSGPMPSGQFAAIGNESIGPEGPPTRAKASGPAGPPPKALRMRRARSAAAAIA